MTKGWTQDSLRHAMSAKGLKSGKRGRGQRQKKAEEVQIFSEEPSLHTIHAGEKIIVIEMSPDDYLYGVGLMQLVPCMESAKPKQLKKLYKIKKKEDYINWQKEFIYEGSLKVLRKLLKKGEKLGMPFLDYISDGQEGRNRAFLAKQMGMKKIPVTIVYKGEPPCFVRTYRVINA